MKIIENIKLDIPDEIGKDFITKVFGGKSNPQIDKIILERKEQCIENIEPRAIYDLFSIKDVMGAEVFFDNGLIFTGPNISKILKGSRMAGIFICTLGQKVDDVVKDASGSGDTLSTIIMDSITTEILTCLADYIGEFLKKEGISEQGWNSTCSYSPGQYRWTIEEQKKLFEMVDGEKIGVNLNSSYLMIPFKSISAVYGFGPKETIDKTRVACDLCPRENCISRR